jgi:plastocyanin
MKRILRASVAVALLSLAVATLPAVAQDEKSYTLTIKDHKFEPARLEVPADTKVKLVIKNLDSTPEEFEMTSPKREKVVKGGQEGTIFVGPFKPGTYEFFGEFNPKTARGQIVVK